MTNGVSAIAQAQFSGSPLVVVGGRAPQNRWGSGSLQELDQPPILAPVSKLARTIHTAPEVADGDARGVHRWPAPRTAGRSSSTSRWTSSSTAPRSVRPVVGDAPAPRARRRRHLRASPSCSAEAQRPVLVLGTDVWADGAEEAALRLVEEAGIPAITNGMGRGVIPGGHPLLVTKARGAAFGGADLVVVVGTPLDFRLGLRRLRRQGRRDPGARRTPRRLPRPGLPARRPRGRGLRRPHARARRPARRRRRPACASPTGPTWVDGPAGHRRSRRPSATPRCSSASADPIHPARIYGELVPRLAEDSIVIGDGGDFVSFAGKFVEPKRPGGWLDPGPYGCLGAGLGAAIAARLARPSAQVVLLLRRRRRRHVADGRRHARPAQPAGRDGLRQQLRLGPGEGPDADALRVRRGGRPRAADPLRRGGEGPRRRRRDGHRPDARSARPSTAPSPPTSPTSST